MYLQQLAGARVFVSVAVVLVEADGIGHVGECVFRLLGQGVLGYGLKRLLHVDGLFGGGFKVGDLVLGVAPLLSPLGAHLQSVAHSYNRKRKFGITNCELHPKA